MTRPPNNTHSPDSLAGGVFVGRQGEVGELKAALEDALSGRGRMVMLVGEPGIGKTRTAQELAAHSEAQGAHVLWGRCHEQPGMPPYWPWVRAVRSHVREYEPDRLRSEMGAGRPTSPRSSRRSGSDCRTSNRLLPRGAPRRPAFASSTPLPPSSRTPLKPNPQ